MLKLLSLDVWNTLLRLDLMYYAIAEVLSAKGFGEVYDLRKAIGKVHAEAKALKAEGKLPINEGIVKESLKMLSQELRTNAEVLRSAIRRASHEVISEGLVYDGVIEVLDAAREMNLKIVLLGNVLFWGSEITKSLLKEAGILGLVDATYFADEIGLQKPDPRAFHRPLRDFGFKPTEAIHVGDSITEDFGGALSAGLSAALIFKDLNKPIHLNLRIFIIPSLKFLTQVLHKLTKP